MTDHLSLDEATLAVAARTHAADGVVSLALRRPDGGPLPCMADAGLHGHRYAVDAMLSATAPSACGTAASIEPTARGDRHANSYTAPDAADSVGRMVPEDVPEPHEDIPPAGRECGSGGVIRMTPPEPDTGRFPYSSTLQRSNAARCLSEAASRSS